MSHIIKTRSVRTTAALLAVAAAPFSFRVAAADDHPTPATTPVPPRQSFVLRGVIHDPGHGPVGDALVQLVDPSNAQIVVARSDAGGRFALPPVPGGPYRIVISHPAFMTATSPLDLGPRTTDLDVLLAPDATAQNAGAAPAGPTSLGALADAGPEPADAGAAPVGPAPDAGPESPPAAPAEAPATLGLPPDAGPEVPDAAPVAPAPGAAPETTVAPPAGAAGTAGALAQSFVLRGAVSGTARAPVEGAVVRALDPSNAPIAEARSDAHGAFDLPPLPGGSYRIVVSHPDFVTKSETVDLGSATGPLDVVLEEEAQEVHVYGGRATAQIGSSVSVLSRKDIQTLPGGDAQPLTQIMLTQPGFTPDTYGPDGIFHIRGEETGVLYVVDGVPIPVGLTGQFIDVLPTALVQSMRLITGGQPVEYGPNVGGVVDVTTRRGTEAGSGGVQMVYGTYQKAQPSFWYSQLVDKTDVFVSGTFLSTQRGLDAPVASPIIHDDLLSGDAVTRIDYRPSDHDRIELFARYSQQRFQIPLDPTLLPLSDAPANATRGSDIYGNSPPDYVPLNANPTESERDLFATASYSHAFTGALLQISPYFRSSYGNLDCDPDGSLGATADPGSICSDVARNLLHEGLNTTYAWTVGSAQRWKTGFTFDVSQSKIDYTQFTRDDASPVGGPDPSLTIGGTDETNYLSGGAFLQDEITLGDFKLFPGLRADVQDTSFVGTGLPDLVLAGPSARLGFSYALTPSVVLHGFAGYLWQPPNEVDGAVAARVLDVAPGQALPVDVKAERDESAEVGLSYRIPQRFEATLTGYGRISQDTIDVQTVGSTDLIVDYNYIRGRAVGAEIALHGVANRYLQGFGNASWDVDQGFGIGSETYLFPPAQVSYPGWQILDHVQRWTANAGIDLHDEAQKSHAAVTFQYGSGLRTGAFNVETVPGHSTWNLTLRHRFDFGSFHPEVAVDVFNVFDAVYAIRIANGYFGSAYGALREVNVRLTVPFGT